jgi:6,7-dimethyl-8-ribityllumazine synthase
MPTFHGDTNNAAAGRYGIVVSRYNESITKNLLDGATATLKSAGVKDEAIDVAFVPGAFEIPLIADQMAGSGKYIAVLCLGAVIRGDTSHDLHINRAVSLGITEANLRHGIPVLFGVLTCDTLQQAIQRSMPLVTKPAEPSASESARPTKPAAVKSPVSNKGVECAQAALEMVSLLQKLRTMSNVQ